MGLLNPPLMPGERVATMSDERLHACFCATGAAKGQAEDLLVGMLGEIERRGIPQRAHGLSLEYYAKLHGRLTEENIQVARRLQRAFADTPRLREVFENGRTSLHKLRVIATVARPDRDAMLALAVMPGGRTKRELEELAAQLRQEDTPPPAPPPAAGATDGGPQQPTLGFDAVASERPGTSPSPAPRASTAAPAGTTPTPPAPAPMTPAPAGPHEPAHSRLEPTVAGRFTIDVGPVVHERLLHEQARLAEARGRNVSMDEVLRVLLDGDKSRSTYIPVVWATAEGGPMSLRTCGGDLPVTTADLEGMKPACPPIDLENERRELEAIESARTQVPRRRSAPLDRYLRARSGGRCEMDCTRPGTGAHHWDPYGNGGKHTPSNLTVGCKLHRSLADQGLMYRTANGEIRQRPCRPVDPTSREEARARVFQDQYVQHRKQAIERAKRRPLKKKS